jgi:hypothetical protein
MNTNDHTVTIETSVDDNCDAAKLAALRMDVQEGLNAIARGDVVELDCEDFLSEIKNRKINNPSIPQDQ